MVDAVVVEVRGGSVEASFRDHRTVRDARRYLCGGEEARRRGGELYRLPDSPWSDYLLFGSPGLLGE